MRIFPAIDLYDGKAVRLYKGDYDQMTVYDDDPAAVAMRFAACGAQYLHLVDLEGARDGSTANLKTVTAILKQSKLFTELGGGIRTLETAGRYLDLGVDRVILGTAAATDPDFVADAVALYGDKIAVGADIKDGEIAIRGWRASSGISAEDFFQTMQNTGVKTVICTDISRDGAMRGANRALYKTLSERYAMDIVASGGVSDLDDIAALCEMGLYGAIVGKAYYTGAIDLARAIEVAK